MIGLSYIYKMFFFHVKEGKGSFLLFLLGYLMGFALNVIFDRKLLNYCNVFLIKL